MQMLRPNSPTQNNPLFWLPLDGGDGRLLSEQANTIASAAMGFSDLDLSRVVRSLAQVGQDLLAGRVQDAVVDALSAMTGVDSKDLRPVVDLFAAFATGNPTAIAIAGLELIDNAKFTQAATAVMSGRNEALKFAADTLLEQAGVDRSTRDALGELVDGILDKNVFKTVHAVMGLSGAPSSVQGLVNAAKSPSAMARYAKDPEGLAAVLRDLGQPDAAAQVDGLREQLEEQVKAAKGLPHQVVAEAFGHNQTGGNAFGGHHSSGHKTGAKGLADRVGSAAHAFGAGGDDRGDMGDVDAGTDSDSAGVGASDSSGGDAGGSAGGADSNDSDSGGSDGGDGDGGSDGGGDD